MLTKRNGRWSGRVYDPATRNYVWLGTFDRKKDAEAKEREVRLQLQMGTYQAPKRITFAEFVDKWLETVTVRESSLHDYRNTCRHLTAFFGKRSLSSITTEDVEAFVADFSKTHAPNTTRKAVTRLRQLFGRALAWQYVAHDPTREVGNVPKARKTRDIHVLDPDQVADLLAAVPAYWRPLFQTAVSTGLRRSELFGLTWADVFWTERKVRVRHQLQSGSLAEPKSDAAKRRIDVGPALLQVLAEHKKTCPVSHLDLVFPTPTGVPIHASDFNRDVFKPSVRRALLPDVVLHDLRHTFASALIQAGLSVKYVQTVMGHASAQTTLDVYGHLFETSGQDAARRLEGWLWGNARRNTDAERQVG